MSLRTLASKRRTIDVQIREAECHMDQMALAIEDLRRRRDALAVEIRDHVMGLPIAQACTELADSVLDAEVIV